MDQDISLAWANNADSLGSIFYEDDVFFSLMTKVALRDGVVFHHTQRRGHLSKEKPGAMEAELLALGYRLVCRKEENQTHRCRRRACSKHKHRSSTTTKYQSIYARSDPMGYVFMMPTGERDQDEWILSASVHGQESVDEIAVIADRFFTRSPQDGGRVYMLVRSMNGISLRQSKGVGEPLERGNYGEEVVTAFDRAVSELSATKPHGRFLLLDGPPGTGKTYFVRGLIHATRSSCAFLVVPSRATEALADPELLPMLLDATTERWPDRKTVLLIEDADGAILPRGSDNHSAITALLNLSDGIIGDASDVRFVVTTNAKNIEVDQALLRPGRLIDRIGVPALSPEQAQIVAKRLTGGAKGAPPFERASTLAEVYKKCERKG